MADPYFATLEGAELIAALRERFKRFEDNLAASGDLEAMEISAREYYGQDEKGRNTLATHVAGSAGQLRVLKTGHYRSVLQNKLTIASADTPAFIPVASNTDAKTQMQTLLAKGIIQYEMDEGGDEEAVDDAVEQAELLMWAWLIASWDENAGEVAEKLPVFAPEDEGNPDAQPVSVREIREGAPRVDVVLPTDMAIDFASRRKSPEWVIHRGWENRHNLAAQLRAEGREAHAQAVENLSLTSEERTQRLAYVDATGQRESDEVPVYEFRHESTGAVPGGKRVRYVGDVELKNGPLPYKDISVRQVKTAKRFGTPRAYAAAHDILGLQQAVDVLYSIGYSNARAFGGLYVHIPDGSPITPAKFTDAVTAFKGGTKEQAPTPLNFHQPGTALESLKGSLVKDMANIQGMDDLSMGRETRTLPGNAMALLDTRTQRSVSKLAATRVNALKWVADVKLRLYKTFAAHSRKLPLVVGKSKQHMLQEFNRDSLADIDRVMIQTASPLMKQPAGRLEIANNLLTHVDPVTGASMIDARSYIAMLETGQYEPGTEAPMAKLLWARSTAEKLAKGEQVTPLVSDDPTLCIPEWLTVLSSQEARNDQAIATNVLTAVQTMLDLWTMADPRLLAVLKIPPPPMPMMPGDPTAPPAPGAQSATSPPASGAPPSAAGAEPTQPNLPTVPTTGEEYSPTAGVQS